MAATDKPYRSPKSLDIVFAVSCILMLISTVWMFAADYYRDYKTVQRKFRDVEEAIADRAMIRRLPDKATVEAAERKVADARKLVEEEADKIKGDVRKLLKDQAEANATASSLKADYDSQVSLLNIEIEHLGEAEESTRANHQALVDAKRKLVDEIKQKLDAANLRVEEIDQKLKEVRANQTLAEKAQSTAEDELKAVSAEFDRFAKAAAQKRWKWGDWIRTWPVIDGFASPLKIQQYVLEELPIDYNFKRVPRFDRCTTCHLGIDRANFDIGSLRALASADGDKEKLDQAHALLAERQKLLGDKALPFNLSDLPASVRTMELTAAQIKEYAAHPRLDLFVDANSPHPIEKFGCTICHAGQGSSTDFLNATHTPNDAKTKKEWEEGPHHWEHIHFWDYPMLPKRFTESSCLQCHHQVVDLANAAAKSEMRDGKLDPGPGAKVLRGYNLVRESGCFGCHEIAGIKSNREVGPDLRLEPIPPLDDLTAADRAEAQSDPMNPPGKMRKVGPSLYRISEKTNQNWTRKWIEAPRTFRPDTKMPHFYGLSNNKKEDLPPDQKDFPDAEIHSITHYLFAESGAYLEGKDTYRLAGEVRKKELDAKQKSEPLNDQDKKELAQLSRRLELAKIPDPIVKGFIGGDGKPLLDANGRPLPLPAAPADLSEGKNLFTLKGCLACHTHREAGAAGDSNFAPNLNQIAAKIKSEKGDTNTSRAWLTQWIMNPNIHFPRTKMPITHLSLTEANAVAAWLLSPQNKEPETKEWTNEADVPAPKSDSFAELAKLYLLKAPGMTRSMVNDILKPTEAGKRQGIAADQVKNMTADADERKLEGPLDDDKLKWYIGKKSVSRMGCFGCHNIPGFEAAKPIGTPLNEWGKKDPARLAFEDINDYVHKHYYAVEGSTDDKGHGYKPEGGKEPYDVYFMEGLDPAHQSREGFLHQKLIEPRSYDYNRIRSWDDRLRMPQFKFARDAIKPLEGEDKEQAEFRAEAEARDAVMTFILGLVGEPIPAKYLYNPPPDRAAEVKGLHVLDKFNCAGCHQLRPGTYEFRVPEDGKIAGDESVLGLLKGKVTDARFKKEVEADYFDFFKNHNAWFGPSQARADRVSIQALPNIPPGEPGTMVLRPTNAFRFNSWNEETKVKESDNMPAGEVLGLPAADLIGLADPHGGKFVDLLIPYVMGPASDGDPNLKAVVANDRSFARSVLPPSLLRAGEKLQPDWIYQFLRNPERVRPSVVLRMPRFNMSDEEAMALVSYFAAVDRLKNPGIGLTAPYLAIEQRDDAYWQKLNTGYRKTLTEAQFAERAKEIGPIAAQSIKDETAELERRLAVFDAEIKAAKDADAKKKAEDARALLKKDFDDLKARVAKGEVQKRMQSQWASQEVYATDAYRMVATSPCLSCHQAPSVTSQPNKYPPLNLAPQRLRPEWTLAWLAGPGRMWIYPEGKHPMPANFPRNDPGGWFFKNEFAGNAFEAISATRDVLMNLQKVADMPANRYYRSAPGEVK